LDYHNDYYGKWVKMKVLNVGAGGPGIKTPPWFEGWQVVRLDIDPQTCPDITMDARKIEGSIGAFDAVYCSHNIEHYSRRDAGRVVQGIRFVLKPGGFADIITPNIGLVLREAGKQGWDTDTFLYQSPAGPVTVSDMLFGHERQIELAEHPGFMAHKSAWSSRTLPLTMSWCGFAHIMVVEQGFDLRCVGFLQQPNDEILAQIGLKNE